jgi:gas vesicle protein
MSSETTPALTGFATGGVVGALAGGLSARGASKRNRALEEARNRYMAALQQHNENLRRIGVAQRDNLMALSGASQQNQNARMAGMPGDQTASYQQDAQNQMAALQAAPLPDQAALSGPLGAQYAQEAAQRTSTALAPMAGGYAADQQGQAFVANDRNYQNNQAALQPQAAYNDQALGVFGGQSASDMAKADAAYGIDRQRAQQAGSEQMLYGALLQQGLNTGASMAGSYARGHQPQPAPANPPMYQSIPNSGVSLSDAMNGYYSRVPNQNSYRMG